MNELINRIKGRLAATNVAGAFPPASEDVLAEAESTLGFKIPPLLRLIYANVANGGFGPGYGIIGVKGGRASNLGTLVETYAEIIRGAEYLGLEWKPGLLAFCEWGCNIFSCVDCHDMRYQIVQSEECKIHVQSYTLEEFCTMWLDDVDILGFSSSPRRTREIVNPFTRKKTRVTGAGDPKGPGDATGGERTKRGKLNSGDQES